jgi:hypothetical protein
MFWRICNCKPDSVSQLQKGYRRVQLKKSRNESGPDGSWLVSLMRIGMRISQGGRRGRRTFTGGVTVGA